MNIYNLSGDVIFRKEIADLRGASLRTTGCAARVIRRKRHEPIL